MPTPRQHASQADRQRAYRQRQQHARLAEQQAKGLPSLPTIPTMPGTARWKAIIEAARTQLDTAFDEMAQYEADRSDEWQQSDRATEHRERMDAIETAIAELEAITF